MSEYQRYEFMTAERPLTNAQLGEVRALSSHIDASATHAVVEYNWGSFRHNPIEVLYKYFDGFLYWANWGSPQLAFRFPHGVMPVEFIEGYDLEDFVTFTQHPDYDILDISFGGMEPPDEWIPYELGQLIGIREELLNGDPRAIYIVWLAAKDMMDAYDEEESYEISVPPVPPSLSTLTSAQRALADLLRVPEELLVAAGRHGQSAKEAPAEEVASSLHLLSANRREDYLVRLARNEPGLGRLLAMELRNLRQAATGSTLPTGQRVTYATLLAESKVIRDELDRKQREKERQAQLRHLRDVHDHRDEYWRRADVTVSRTGGTAYADVTELMVELRAAAEHFEESSAFQERFARWIQPHLRRPALVMRLRDRGFPLPQP